MPPIEVENLYHAYGDRQALAGVTFNILPGEIFGFLGPNGGGKTTLFKILSTLIPVTDGTVRLLGFDLVHASHVVRKHLGVVFQHPSLDAKLTVSETSGITVIFTDCGVVNLKVEFMGYSIDWELQSVPEIRWRRFPAVCKDERNSPRRCFIDRIYCF